MKILHAVEQYHPSVGGMQEVVKQLSERLAAAGHEVTVVTTSLTERKTDKINGVKIVSFNVRGNMVQGMQGDIEAYRTWLENSSFDIVAFFAAQQWTFDAAIPLLNSIKAKKVFIPTGFSGLYRKEYADYFLQMPRWMMSMDASVFLSDNYRDIDFARIHAIKSIHIIPNGADESEFEMPSIGMREKLNIADDEFLILHVGSFTGMKGHKEALQIFLRAGLKKSVLVFSGKQLEVFRKYLWRMLSPIDWIRYFRLRKKIIQMESIRSETVSLFKEADVFLFPSNVECSPLVIFESCAAGTPFLSSDCGNVKEIIEWTNGGLLLPTRIDESGYSHVDIDHSAMMLNELVSDRERLEELGKQGYRNWKEKFTWSALTKKYEDLYNQLTGKSK